VLRSCSRFGGPAATPLERAAATLRARAAVAAEQQAQSAQAQLSARVLTFVPIALLTLLAVTDGKVRAAIGTPAGLAVVVLGGLLNLAGALWMRRIIGRPK
jgi:tight adherence protein B